MASGFSSNFDNNVLDGLLRNAYTPISATYMALFETDAGLEANDVTQWTEITAGGYARVEIPAASMDAAANSAISNNTDVAFAPATEDWPEITTCGIMDSAAGGNCLAYGTLVNPSTGGALTRTVMQGDALVFRAGGIQASIDNASE